MRTEGGTDAAVSPFTYDDGVINVGSRSTDHNRVRTGWGALQTKPFPVILIE